MLRAPLPAKPLQEEGYVPRRWEQGGPMGLPTSF